MKIFQYYGKSNVSGPRIRIARDDKGWTQKQLAEKLQTEGVDVNQKSISRMETGDRVVADYEAMVLARLFGKKVTWLLGME